MSWSSHHKDNSRSVRFPDKSFDISWGSLSPWDTGTEHRLSWRANDNPQRLPTFHAQRFRRPKLDPIRSMSRPFKPIKSIQQRNPSTQKRELLPLNFVGQAPSTMTKRRVAEIIADAKRDIINSDFRSSKSVRGAWHPQQSSTNNPKRPKAVDWPQSKFDKTAAVKLPRTLAWNTWCI